MRSLRFLSAVLAVGLWVSVPASAAASRSFLFSGVPSLHPPGVPCEGPAFIPYSKPPVLVNVGEIRRYVAAIERRLERGASYRVELWIFVTEEGRVRCARLQESAGSTWMDLFAKSLVHRMRFLPAERRGEPVGVWVLQEVCVGNAERKCGRRWAKFIR